MNADTTNIMVFPKTKANEICVKLSETTIKKVQHCRYLGLFIDDTLTWSHHTDTIYSVSQKSSPLKLFAIFSLLVNLCN